MTYLSKTKEVKAQIKAMQEAGIEVEKNLKEGTVIARYNGAEVYRALKKGASDAWIVRHVNDLFEIE